MPIFEQGYRAYEGELSRRRRVLPMAWEGFRTRLRWWTWALLALALLWPTVITLVMILIANGLGGFFGASAADGIPVAKEAFQTAGFDPRSILTMVTGSSAALPWEVLHNSTLWSVLLPAVTCAGILSADRRTGALQIYFARPITQRDYLLAKVTTVAGYHALIALVPALGLWGLAAVTSPDWGFLISTWSAPFLCVLAWAVFAYWTTALVLAMSSLFKRPVYVGVAATVLYLALSVMGALLSETLDDRVWSNLVPGYALGGVVAPLFGLELGEWQQTPWLYAYVFGLPTLLYAWVWRRLRAVEVHT